MLALLHDACAITTKANMTCNQNTNRANGTDRKMTIAEYLIQQLAKQGASLSLAKVAKGLGYENASAIRMFVASEIRIPLDIVLPFARILKVPFPPLYRMAMEQFGENMTEIAAELFDGPTDAAASPQQINDGAVDIEAASTNHLLDSQRSQGAPAMVEINFSVPVEFCLQFVIEAARQGLGLNDFFLLVFQTFPGRLPAIR
jgi:hypothetical protein